MCLNIGGAFFLIFDEVEDPEQDPKTWKELYDPDINHIVGPDAIPS